MLLQRLTIALVLACAPRALDAQPAAGRITLSGGSATDVTGIRSRAATIAPSISLFPSPNVAVGLSASATRFAEGPWSAAGGLGLNARHPIGAAALTLGTAASYTATSYDLSYLTADLTPALEIGVKGFTLYGGAHASHATTWIIRDRFPPLPGPDDFTRERESVGRHGIAGVYGVVFRGVLAGATPMFIGAREERGTVADAEQVDRTMSAGLTHGAISLAANGGLRDVDDTRSRFGSASASISISPVAALELSGGQYAANRLTGASAGRFMSAGLSLRLTRGERALPLPASVSPPAPGMTRLSIHARDARTVEVAGDFTKWQLTVTQRSANGVWFVDLGIPPGQYRYAFRIDGKEWRIPDGVAATEDEFGGKTAWLTVSRTGTSRDVP